MAGVASGQWRGTGLAPLTRGFDITADERGAMVRAAPRACPAPRSSPSGRAGVIVCARPDASIKTVPRTSSRTAWLHRRRGSPDGRLGASWIHHYAGRRRVVGPPVVSHDQIKPSVTVPVSRAQAI